MKVNSITVGCLWKRPSPCGRHKWAAYRKIHKITSVNAELFFFANRTSIENLDQLTYTNREQAWGKLRLEPFYKGKELNEVFHVQPLPKIRLDEDAKAVLRKRLIPDILQSPLAQPFHGRLHCNTVVEAPDNATIQEHSLLTRMASDHLRVYAEMMFYDVAFTEGTRFRIYRFS